MCCKKLMEALGSSEIKCFQESKGTVSCAENNKEFRLEVAQKNITTCKVKVDGCLIPGNESKKCDYLVKICGPDGTGRIYLVELKGADIDTAFEQIVTTFKLIKDKKIQSPNSSSEIRLEELGIEGIIVNRSVPKAIPKVRKAIEDCKKKYSLRITSHTNQCKMSI
jgi:hypothetical protein